MNVVQKKVYRKLPWVLNIVSTGCVATMSRFAMFFFSLKKISGFFVLKNDLWTFQILYHFTARSIWQVFMVSFELLFCYFCCAFCCGFALNIIIWVCDKFSSCFVCFNVFPWQITIANFLVQFLVAKLLVLVSLCGQGLCCQ